MASRRREREDLDVDDNESVTVFGDEIDVQRYDEGDASEEDGPVCITIDDDNDDDLLFVDSPPQSVPVPKEFELPSHTLACGLIRPGSVVELKDHTGRQSRNLISGDFLFVKAIVENVDSEEIVLRGYRMRRCSYLRPLFDSKLSNFSRLRADLNEADPKKDKLNDVFMLVQTQDSDRRPPFAQGLECIDPEEVIRIRQCAFTHLSYELFGLKHANQKVPIRLTTDTEKKAWIFSSGTLICRWVHIVEHHFTNGVSYSGEARRMYKREVAEFSQQGHLAKPSSNPTDSPSSSTLYESSLAPNTSKRTQNRNSSTGAIDSIPGQSGRTQQELLKKSKVYTMGDGCCGAGGASDGARQAGLHISWGLDKDEAAMCAYRKNFPGARHLEMDAHDFPRIVRRRIHGCDHLHMSCPCCYWSENHTIDGKDDEANILTLFTVEPWLEKIKPRTFSLEQAPGLLKLEKHKKYFRILINGILSQGYNVRYKIQNLAWFRVPQSRRRLIFVGAKIGTPLPPFPSPIHGPSRSGLKRFVTIGDALRPILRQGPRLGHDKYHQPLKEKRLNKERINPQISLAKCITTSGGDNAHHSGTRANTVRELSLFQGFNLSYKFSGTISDAKKQCGNAWPPAANKHYFQLWAATLEAFDHGLIEAEDEIQDLYAFLEAKGIKIPKSEPIDIETLGFTSRPAEPDQQQYRYLSKLEKTVTPHMPLALWTRNTLIEPLPQRRRAPPFLGFQRSSTKPKLDRTDDQQTRDVNKMRSLHILSSDDESDSASPRRNRTTTSSDLEARFWRRYGGTTITLDDERF